MQKGGKQIVQKMRSPLSKSKEMAFERDLGTGLVLLVQMQESGSKVRTIKVQTEGIERGLGFAQSIWESPLAMSLGRNSIALKSRNHFGGTPACIPTIEPTTTPR